MNASMKVSVLPVAIDFHLVEESDYSLEFQLTDEDGAGLDISAESVVFTVRDSPASPVNLVQRTNAPGQHSDPANGKTVFAILKADLQLAAGKLKTDCHYDVVRVDATLKETPYFKGKLVVHRRTSGTDPA